MENNKKYPTEGYEQVDNLFRKTLEGQRVEPEKSLWKGINRKLLLWEMIRFNFKNVPGSLWVGGIAGIIIIPAILYLTLSPDIKILSKPNPEPQTVQTVPLTGTIGMPGTNGNTSVKNPSNTSPNQITPVTNAGINQPLNEKPSIVINQTASGSVLNEKKTQKDNNRTLSTQLTTKNTQPKPKSLLKSESSGAIAANAKTLSPFRSNIKSNEAKQEKQDKNINDQMVSNESKSPVEVPNPVQKSLSDPSIHPVPSLASLFSLEPDTGRYLRPNLIQLGILPPDQKDHNPIPQYLSIGLGFMPELAFYKTTSSYSKVNYWLGADLSYHLWKFYIRPGISIGYMYNNGAYQVNYKRKDSIGFYYQVVSYTIDPHTGAIIYNTITHAVYDSLIHHGDDQTRNRYEFIQVPLIFGFEFLEVKNFAFSVQAGPVVSFFMADKESQSQITDLTGTRLLTRINSTPPGKSPNWQIWGGLHMDYRIDENFDFYIEPTYKYYFNPVVGNEIVTVKAPWAVGLGIGLKYNFGFNTGRP